MGRSAGSLIFHRLAKAAKKKTYYDFSRQALGSFQKEVQNVVGRRNSHRVPAREVQILLEWVEKQFVQLDLQIVDGKVVPQRLNPVPFCRKWYREHGTWPDDLEQFRDQIFVASGLAAPKCSLFI